MALILPVLSWLAAYLAADLLATKGKSSLFTPTRIMAMGAVAVAIILLGALNMTIRALTVAAVAKVYPTDSIRKVGSHVITAIQMAA